MAQKVFLSLGSNLGLCSKNLENAIASISRFKGVRVGKVSQVYKTEPQDVKEQPWFYNQVVELEVDDLTTPEHLLKLLKQTEKVMGRLDIQKKGPRIIDLDILWFDNMIINTNDLIIPHPAMRKRAFVLVPLREICPDFTFPDGDNISMVLGKICYKVKDYTIFQPE
ncbi:2-amino-4-hydroxy-6-hydroxymethyldihydropteridine diphosphokinase [Desulfonatronovibrio magnus]|uniref:2-amino-4-hydroxy-6- hydroxymethyldihydropteridine diphosphokinase n=1 Tax=Desulfonatronovibrio magnus TaxID=698827 RepID=UPI000A02D45D|nr:2-amino-4-hydroxy-6-hydroxymethyldihydropteridine diphosphokinase [Desulfonatronovibrio magnus]RQD57661.1 MAG: 2-amino-4-hydroxy-6-hydroxymethyldihydropteridine diphosphokinase [Desulfonatronovibrio sp. MSAO_Bac4]